MAIAATRTQAIREIAMAIIWLVRSCAAGGRAAADETGAAGLGVTLGGAGRRLAGSAGGSATACADAEADPFLAFGSTAGTPGIAGEAGLNGSNIGVFEES